MDTFSKALPRRRFLLVALSATALVAVPFPALAAAPPCYGRGYAGGYS